LRNGRGPEDAPLPRVVRPRDPASTAALDDGLRVRRVRDRGRGHPGNLDAGLPRRGPPRRRAHADAVPAPAVSRLAPRDGLPRRRAIPLPGARALARDRPLGQPRVLGASAARPAAPGLPWIPPSSERDDRLGSGDGGPRRGVLGPARAVPPSPLPAG